jgi:hypothetical protein
MFISSEFIKVRRANWFELSILILVSGLLIDLSSSGIVSILQIGGLGKWFGRAQQSLAWCPAFPQ